MKIPEDMYERVFGFATGLTNASETGDTKTYWQLYSELAVYCEAEAAHDHPFLWETLADFTTDDQAAVALYVKALANAMRLGATEHEASILFLWLNGITTLATKRLLIDMPWRRTVAVKLVVAFMGCLMQLVSV